MIGTKLIITAIISTTFFILNPPGNYYIFAHFHIFSFFQFQQNSIIFDHFNISLLYGRFYFKKVPEFFTNIRFFILCRGNNKTAFPQKA